MQLELLNEDEAIQLMVALRARRRELERVINALNLDLETRGRLALVNRLIHRLEPVLDAAAQQQCAGSFHAGSSLGAELPGPTSGFDSQQPLHLP